MIEYVRNFGDIKVFQKKLMQSFIDISLETEMEEHLNYPMYQKADKLNKHNGHTKKTIRSDKSEIEEFKGTGNQEITLERDLAEKRVFPAINIKKSGTRREERLLDEDTLRKVWILRKLLQPMDGVQATEFLLERLKESKTNDEFFDQMTRKSQN